MDKDLEPKSPSRDVMREMDKERRQPCQTQGIVTLPWGHPGP